MDQDKEIVSFGSILRRIRERLGLTQVEFSEVLGIHPTGLSYYECNRRLGCLVFLRKILNYCLSKEEKTEAIRAYFAAKRALVDKEEQKFLQELEKQEA